jgi:hypothetical protein
MLGQNIIGKKYKMGAEPLKDIHVFRSKLDENHAQTEQKQMN